MIKLGLGYLLAISLIAFQTEKIQAQVSRSPGIEELRTTPQQADERLGWWRDARFGMFVHWGVSSELGGTWKGKVYYGYAEHIQRIAMIPIPTYIKEVAGNLTGLKFPATSLIYVGIGIIAIR